MRKLIIAHCATFRIVSLMVLVILLLSLAVFPFVFPVSASAKEEPGFQVPETLEGAKEGALDIGGKIMESLPKVVANLWNNRVIPVWRQMGEWTKAELWERRISPVLQSLADRIQELLGQEIEKRKPIIEQELEKEKQELTEELKEQGEKTRKNLWERFRALFRAE